MPWITDIAAVAAVLACGLSLVNLLRRSQAQSGLADLKAPFANVEQPGASMTPVYP
jgi:hypothetical protein